MQVQKDFNFILLVMEILRYLLQQSEMGKCEAFW